MTNGVEESSRILFIFFFFWTFFSRNVSPSSGRYRFVPNPSPDVHVLVSRKTSRRLSPRSWIIISLRVWGGACIESAAHRASLRPPPGPSSGSVVYVEILSGDVATHLRASFMPCGVEVFATLPPSLARGTDAHDTAAALMTAAIVPLTSSDA